MMRRTLWLLSALALTHADIYMHNPRGSNDRNCERNANRNNGNRLFDSQNNAKGGYACPRAVGDDEIQDEDGDTLTFNGGFNQNKKMYYYEGSILPIEWTNQHGCGGNSKVSCEIILQYACEDTLDPQVDNFWPFTSGKNNEINVGMQHFRFNSRIAAPRDGIPRDTHDAATDTIPNSETAAIPSNRENRRYGMHESYDFYQLCRRTSRNKGLYTADQNMRRNDQRGTRQNPNGNRRGLECPEERDYYPWWHPSPWIDVAVLTDSALDTPCTDPTEPDCSYRCAYYLSESMNKNTKSYCDVDHETGDVESKLTHQLWRQSKWYNEQDECEESGVFTWYNVSHADNLKLDYPVCAKAQFARANQLGNARNDDILSISVFEDDDTVPTIVQDAVVEGVNANRFVWQIPKIPKLQDGVTEDEYFNGFYGNGLEDAYKSCVVRIRYNISSSDFPAWPAGALDPASAAENKMVDHLNNSISSSDNSNTPLIQDPYVYIGPGDSESTGNAFVSLAVNTNQYSRTFQDRSYTFTIKPLPQENVASNDETDTPKVDVQRITEELGNGHHIYNVNVRGKRGNIVQTYPSVEYDFVPNMLKLEEGDMIHFQWTGSDYNPRRGCNDAEGGPPDLNTFFTSANANFNSRADRSNLIFTNSMGHNTPTDMLGYDPREDGLTFSQKQGSAKDMTLSVAPCADNDDCYEQVMRLAYLNQQSDGGSLSLRQNRNCLTEEELDQIAEKSTRENHPLNCAKLNAKPYPYFDGGVMRLTKSGYFPFFSSRNNNFSNREQIGILCVGNGCTVDDGTGVMQSANPSVQMVAKRTSNSRCNDEASADGIGNNFGASSCIDSSTSSILTDDTFDTPQADNDALGDGDKNPCEVMQWSVGNTSSVEEEIALAIGLLFAGIGATWLGYYLYNRYRASRGKGQASQFKGQKAWKKATETDMI